MPPIHALVSRSAPEHPEVDQQGLKTDAGHKLCLCPAEDSNLWRRASIRM
jgi:hypothetical protein